MTPDDATALNQNPHDSAREERDLEAAIGAQVRTQRKKLGMTVGALTTLKSLALALNVPFTALFQRFEEQRDASHVKSGEGLKIERRGTRAGHQYALLGHSVHKQVAVEPYMITLTHESEVFPLFQHDGQEFLYVVEGAMDYHHGGRNYRMDPGDSLFFDADAPHGPETLHDLPVRFLSVIVYPRSGD